MEVGVRVVRGPDWKWGHQDEGEGHVGTVVEIGREGSRTSPDKTVVVQWDGGMRTNYRVGYQGAFDLRIIDNAPAGVKHPNIICDGCGFCGILGIHWRCEDCPDYDLCTDCYMTDCHDTSHVFQRFETSSSIGVLVGPRRGETKVPLKGIFIGAKVVRGHDWDWGNQDGGEGKTGRVTRILGWDTESGKSVANVTWTSGSANVYRLGHKGKVDLRCVEPASGGHYYREHLPILGQGLEHVLVGALANRLFGAPSSLTFNVGDKVKVNKDVETLKAMQEDHGGWNPRMAQYIGKVGIVHRVTERGDIRVQYEGCNHRWTFNPAALTKRNCFCIGDLVQIIHDIDKVKEYQKGHGEWIEVMKKALGRVGKVVKIYPDGDLRVAIGGQIWTLNPLSVKLHPEPNPVDHENTNTELSRVDHANPLTSLLSTLKDQSSQGDGTWDVVRKAAQGHVDFVRDFLLKHPEKVDCKSKCRTCLQVASHQGHVEMVQLLLSLGASISLTDDDDGDTALHYAAFGNQPEVMELLLKAGADCNALNEGSCTPLHVAVNKQHVNCVRVLLKWKCNVNIKDSYGDTALHDAIAKDNLEITEMLCSVPGLDFTLRNHRGFNVFHHAAVKGNSLATEKLLLRSRQLVDVKKDDGFAALHLACLNGHRAVAETLLVQGQAEIDLRNNRRQTPLILAVSQGHCSLVELCVSLRADIHAADEDGYTALHIALLRRASIPVSDISELEAPTIFGIHSMLVGQADVKYPVATAIACYLIQEGCSLEKQDKKGKTPLDFVSDSALQEILKKYVTHRSFSPVAAAIPSGSGERAVPALQIDILGNNPSQSNGLVNGIAVPFEEPVSTPPRSRRQSRVSTGGHSSPSSSSDLNGADRPVPVECIVCSELADQNVKFEPCMHRIACEDCASRMKKCLKCGQNITKRLTQDGRIIACKSRQPSAERLRYLESKIAEIEEAHCCSICMERRRNVVFLCGHSACDKCSHTLKTCHMCRKAITKKINVY